LSVDLSVTFHPGTDANGRVHTIDDKILRVGTVSLEPSDMTNGMLQYDHVISLPADVLALTHFPITLPTASGLDPAFTLQVPIIARVGDRAIRLVEESDLRLHYVGDFTTAKPGAVTWRVELSPACGTVGAFARLEAQGLPPATITVPWTLLDSREADSFETCLSIAWVESVAGPYNASLTVTATLEWSVTLQATAESTASNTLLTRRGLRPLATAGEVVGLHERRWTALRRPDGRLPGRR
jgi:hypothetical protein